ncbi:MAG TPA: zf-HC2 domain-containing protein [Arthrobacter sp.]|nr:zf-HC2 domain-containing protein [Arthrobacter sp.]
MRHPERDLAEYLDGELADERRPGFERHLQRCARCRESVAEHRAIQERLRALDVPPPGPDLASRILSRSSHAFVPAPTGTAADGPVSATAELSKAQGGSAGSPRRRTALTVCSVLTGFAALTAATAYVLGGEDSSPVASGAGSSGTDWQGPQELESNLAGSVDELDRDGLAELRGVGWNCPQLVGMGYEFVSARKIEIAGAPAVRIELANEETGTVVVTEQRRGVEPVRNGEPDATRAEAAVNAVTGNTVAADGFNPVDGMDREMWVHSANDWTVVLDSENVTYTVWADIPLSALPETVNQIIVTEKSRLMLPKEEPADDPVSRVIRGLGKLIEPAGQR